MNETKPNTATSALGRLFERQQPKVNARRNMGKLLCQFAEEDHKRIAQLIQTWLAKDEQRKQRKPLK